jgi:hypothetical protein
MPDNWDAGSTRRWRKIRATVIATYGWTCHLCKQPIDPKLKHPDPYSLHVHHLDGKKYGDNPDRCRPAHAICNLKAGQPGQRDPEPQPRTRW